MTLWRRVIGDTIAMFMVPRNFAQLKLVDQRFGIGHVARTAGVRHIVAGPLELLQEPASQSLKPGCFGANYEQFSLPKLRWACCVQWRGRRTTCGDCQPPDNPPFDARLGIASSAFLAKIKCSICSFKINTLNGVD